MANWIKRYGEIPLECKSFQKILDFYLFQCPCETKKDQRKRVMKYIRVFLRVGILYGNAAGLVGI